VDDALFMGLGQPLGNLLGDIQSLVHGHGAIAKQGRQIITLDQLHDQNRALRRRFEAEDGGDVGMVQRREKPGLAFEARHAVRIGGERPWQALDRHLAIKLGVRRLPHHPHAALADLCDEPVVQQILTRPDSQACPSEPVDSRSERRTGKPEPPAVPSMFGVLRPATPSEENVVGSVRPDPYGGQK
jgi:hypothetical protein